MLFTLLVHQDPMAFICGCCKRHARQSVHLWLTCTVGHLRGELPGDWTLGRIATIFKNGDRQDPGNYHLVSLKSITCKVLESLIPDEMLRHFQDCDLRTPCQHGFRPRHSCSSQLIEVLDDWSKALEANQNVNVVYLDFQKGFGSVPHQCLIHKLHCYGISGKLLAWIEKFLPTRTQQVALNGFTSEWTKVISGSPGISSRSSSFPCVC